MSIPEQALRNRKFISFHKKISTTLLNEFLGFTLTRTRMTIKLLLPVHKPFAFTTFSTSISKKERTYGVQSIISITHAMMFAGIRLTTKSSPQVSIFLTLPFCAFLNFVFLFQRSNKWCSSDLEYWKINETKIHFSRT